MKSNLAFGMTIYGHDIYDKVKRLKPEFDKLTDYKQKLDFWYKNELSICLLTYGITDDVDKKDLPENNISIEPQNNSEKIAWKKWYYKIFNTDNSITLATRKAEYDKKIKDKTEPADPIPVTKNIIAKIENEYAKDKKRPQVDMRLYSVGFEFSQNGEVPIFLNSDYFPPNYYYMEQFCLGVIDEKYKRFLEQQLKELEKPQIIEVGVNIRDFENFIYGCNNILDNTLFDIIVWDPTFNKESWEQRSFIANGIMKTAQRAWDKYGEDIGTKAHCSKTNIKHIIYVEQNTIIIELIKGEMEKLINRLNQFEVNNNMFHCDIMPNNLWFAQLFDLVSNYQEWFYELVNPLQKVLPTQQVEAKVEQIASFKLSDIFESISKYQQVMNLLVEKEHCQPNTFIWKDSGKGNKGLLVAILKHLHKQGFYKENKCPSNKQIKCIAQNTFGLELSIDTIKKAKPEKFDLTFMLPSSILI